MKQKKKKLWIIIILFVFASIFAYGYLQTNGNDDSMMLFDAEVFMSDGKANGSLHNRELEVLEEGLYEFHLICKPDKEGLLTGCVLQDENGDILFSCTGEEMDVVSKELELEKGVYTIQFCYITNESDWKKFMEEKEAELIGDKEYSFQDNGEWNIHYEYGFVDVESPSLSSVLGMICGIAVGLLLVVALKWIVKKMGGKVTWGYNKDSYDERQLLARGEAYKVAFFTMLAYVVVVSLLYELYDIAIFMSFAGMWVGVCLSIFVFATICIWKDAYMSLYENAKGIVLLFTFIAILNIICSFSVISGENPVLERGAISINCINLIVGILIFLILIVFTGKLVYNKRYTDDEDEE